MKTLKFTCKKCKTTVTLKTGDYAVHIPRIICPECKAVIREAEETGATEKIKLNLLEG